MPLRRFPGTMFIIAVAVASCSDAPTEVTPVKGGTATIVGRVTVNGQLSPPDFIRIDADPQCRAQVDSDSIPAEAIVLGSGNVLANAFVYVKDGLAHPYPSREAA